MAFDRLKARQAGSEEVAESPKEEAVEETQENLEVKDEISESQEPQEESTDGLKPVEGETERERALRLEVTRLKAERRKTRSLDLVKGEDSDEPATVSKAEAVVLNAFQQEAFDEFLKKYPQYETNDDAWGKFMSEFNDRLPILEAAKRQNTPITKSFISKRLESIHNSLGIDMTSAMEEGKKDLLRSQAAAKIAATGFAAGDRESKESVIPRKRILPKAQSGLRGWITK